MDRYTLYYLIGTLSFILTFGAQMYIRSTYSKYGQIRNAKGIKGANAAAEILSKNNLEVNVAMASGYLSDHYDPRNKMVVLSQNNFEQESIASVAIAAHECGHALQDAQGYSLLRARAAMFPVVRFSSYAGYASITIGIIFGIINLIWLGIFLEMIILLFQIITLPVEFDASSRALAQLEYNNILNDEELSQAKTVLTAAAMTYVASVATTFIEIMRLIMMFGIRRDRSRR